jgi:predicted DNA-binding protein (MmcQ/YjbR family)
MTPAAIRRHCLSLPGAELSVKWGDDQCYVIGGKMFAAHGPKGEGLSFKCTPDGFAMLTESGVATPARYLARAHWVTIVPGAMPGSELKQRLSQAYAIVRAGLPKKVQAALPPSGE